MSMMDAFEKVGIKATKKVVEDKKKEKENRGKKKVPFNPKVLAKTNGNMFSTMFNKESSRGFMLALVLHFSSEDKIKLVYSREDVPEGKELKCALTSKKLLPFKEIEHKEQFTTSGAVYCSEMGRFLNIKTYYELINWGREEIELGNRELINYLKKKLSKDVIDVTRRKFLEESRV